VSRAAYHQVVSTALILYGPKAVGKSWIAHILVKELRVYHLDPDELISGLLAAGKQPDPQDGWLAEVAAHVQDALADYGLVSVEATGAWESDWRLARELEAGGARVYRVWVSAPKELALRRLQTRTAPRVPVSADEASWIYDAATARAASIRFDLKLDTGTGVNPEQVIEAVRPLVAGQHP
jgi:predicted kinase